MKVRTISYTTPQIGDEVKVENSIFRDDVKLYICYISDSLIYVSYDKRSPKDECESFFPEDVTI